MMFGNRTGPRRSGPTERATVCGELVALSVTVRVAEAAPVVVGLKAILRSQPVPAASDGVQVVL